MPTAQARPDAVVKGPDEGGLVILSLLQDFRDGIEYKKRALRRAPAQGVHPF